MFPKYEMKRLTTVKTIKSLLDTKPDKACFIMRHSERHFHENARMEPFMGLTENGKNESIELGSSIERQPIPKLFASHFGRCIETAYLFEKGYSKKHAKACGNVELCIELTPFYITDIEKAIGMVSEMGSNAFLRSWFNKEISEDVMLNSEEAAQTIVEFMKKELKKMNKGELGVFVSHDWNIFPIKEFFFGLKHEECGHVGYLDSVFLFEKNNNYYLSNHQADAVVV